MTDLEISKALALAIGWTKYWVVLHDNEQKVTLCVSPDGVHPEDWRVFDYRDWSVIGPIAERYDCFPYKNCARLWDVWCSDTEATKTPQKAIALVAIGLSEGEK